MNWLVIALTGAVGVVLRVAISRWFASSTELAGQMSWPWATFTINIVGSFLIGAAYAVMSAGEVRIAIVAGLLGGFTTFSAFSWETLQLFTNQQVGLAIAYGALSPILGVLACFVAMRLFA